MIITKSLFRPIPTLMLSTIFMLQACGGKSSSSSTLPPLSTSQTVRKVKFELTTKGLRGQAKINIGSKAFDITAATLQQLELDITQSANTLALSILERPILDQCTLSATEITLSEEDVQTHEVNLACTHKKLYTPQPSDAISPAPGSITSLKLALAENGDALTAWIGDNNNADLYKSHRRNLVWNIPSSTTDIVNFSGVKVDQKLGWGTPNYDIAISSNGEAAIGWTAPDADMKSDPNLVTTNRIYVRQFLQGAWNTLASSDFKSITGGVTIYPPNGNPPVLVPNVGAGHHSITPQLAMDGQGNITLAYTHFFQSRITANFANYLGYLSRFDRATSSWQITENRMDYKTPYEGDVAHIQICSNQAGDLALSWDQNRAGASISTARAFIGTAEKGAWNLPQSFSDHVDLLVGDITTTKVAINKQGDILLGFIADTVVGAKVFASIRKKGQPWLHSQSIDDALSLPNSDVGLKTLALDISEGGDAVVAWVDQNSNVMRAHYRNNKWNRPQSATDHIGRIQTGNGSPLSVAMDAYNNAIVAYSGRKGSSNTQVLLDQFSEGTWRHDTPDGLIAIDANASEVSMPAIAMTQESQMLVVWSERTLNNMAGTNKIFAAEYR